MALREKRCRKYRMEQDSETTAAKLFACLSKRVAITEFLSSDSGGTLQNLSVRGATIGLFGTSYSALAGYHGRAGMPLI